MKQLVTSLMFVGEQAGKANEAVHFYTSTFKDSEIIHIEYYQKGEHEPEGAVKNARFTLNGHTLMALDSHLSHKFSFTPASSLYIECDSEDELRELHSALAEQGSELMPVDNYGFSRLFCWLNDKYGVSWQLNLAE
ncbi:VOC family protein [Pseudidiomarina sediminum]|uniref:VOC family protein n=1 Tax=Pseudidiomarina sediminum TaxID=431675 RepID=A0A432ZAD7_9GAMM|nr:VOC family protein [Pseudidiomarina sediminum]RUO74916.1 VOC family protein [Pseudidiomarina sediminum]